MGLVDKFATIASRMMETEETNKKGKPGMVRGKMAIQIQYQWAIFRMRSTRLVHFQGVVREFPSSS